ncbi:hypothetical protein K458DRAFT_411615 [Lentithecium fluviatile CBS 122367]|uniref:Telomere replication protein EST3 n=1 Tax=Lentithecium fluviatile CBS 122367 TaxID=1168545 RepID=A0A6G1JP23_9PLEO|nr:hypothetical protein K458DRAFT_411615 [Lentithecium fluviatile CBS 122367]
MSWLASWLEVLTAEHILLADSWCRDRAKETQKQILSAAEREWAGIYEDNGSCIDSIDETIPERNSNLQVLEKHPLTLTDGAASIEATLTPDCQRDLCARYPGKRVSSAYPNCVIAVRKYTIRYTPYGPPRSHLTLILHAIDWKGEGAEKRTGYKHISACDQVRSALQRLWKTRLAADRRCFLSEPDDEPTMAAPGRPADAQGGSEDSTNTQMPFGTQVAQEQVFAGNTRQEESRADMPNPQDTQKAQLLSLLHRTGSRDAAPHLPSVAPVAPSAGGFTRTKTSDVRRDVGAPAAASRTPILPGRPDRFLRDPVNSSRPGSPRVHGQHTLPARLADDRRNRSLETQVDDEPPPMSDKPLFEPTSSELAEDDLVDEEPEWLQGCRPTCGSAIAPTKQRTLLTKAECWQKPEAGYRFPDANIPIEILRDLKEHARNNMIQEPSSPIGPHDDDEQLSDAGDLDADVDAGADEDEDAEMSSSQISWPISPAPQSPKRQGLPPDSSLEVDNNKNARVIPHAQAIDQRKPEPVIIGSSNETVDPPSSPPVMEQNNDSDEEMELELPRGLDESPKRDTRTSAPRLVQPAPAVQVKETPHAKEKIGVAVPPVGQQTSSGEPKDTSSTSVIYCTYKNANSSGEKEALETVAQQLPPASATLAPQMFETFAQAHAEASLSQRSKHVHFPSAGASDIFMENAPPEIPRGSKPPERQHEGIGTQELDDNVRVALPEPSPISPQRPPPDLSSSKEKAVELMHANSSEQIRARTDISQVAHMKRKLDTSPSKKPKRSSKRRQIKIVDFDGDSPPPPIRYKDTELHRARQEVLNRFRPELDTVFQKFKAAYPEYTGSTQHFMGQCKQMYKLDLEDKMVPKWQWDDFVIRNSTDYKHYLLQCSEEGEDPEPYYRFYKDNMRDTLYSKSVLKNRKTLLSALDELGDPIIAGKPTSTISTYSALPRASAAPTVSTAPVTLVAPTAPAVAVPPVTLVPSSIGDPARKPSRKSLPWDSNLPKGSSTNRDNSASGDRSRLSLPNSTNKAQPTPHVNPPLRHTPLQSAPASKPSTGQATRKTHLQSGTSTLTSRTSTGSSATKRPVDLSKIPTEPTGDFYRDYFFAYQRKMASTGSTVAESKKEWPDNMAVRPKAEVPRKKGHDVLE